MDRGRSERCAVDRLAGEAGNGAGRVQLELDGCSPRLKAESVRSNEAGLTCAVVARGTGLWCRFAGLGIQQWCGQPGSLFLYTGQP